MTLKAVGFYWTLPVPWAGLTRLPNQIDEAAKVSRTIRYQRDLIRRYAADERYELIHEQVCLEVEPDRGSDLILEPLEKARKICLKNDALLLYVDFWEVQRWRAHGALADWLSRTNVRSGRVAPDAINIDGSIFDPHLHFRAWREKREDWVEKKPERVAKARARARELLEQGEKYPNIADTLNKEQLQSATGRPWTSENIRKLMAGG